MDYNVLKEYIASKKLSIHQVEKSAGLGNGTISKWEDGKTSPTLASLEAVADVLKINVTDLLM